MLDLVSSVIHRNIEFHYIEPSNSDISTYQAPVYRNKYRNPIYLRYIEISTFDIQVSGIEPNPTIVRYASLHYKRIIQPTHNDSRRVHLYTIRYNTFGRPIQHKQIKHPTLDTQDRYSISLPRNFPELSTLSLPTIFSEISGITAVTRWVPFGLQASPPAGASLLLFCPCFARAAYDKLGRARKPVPVVPIIIMPETDQKHSACWTQTVLGSHPVSYTHLTLPTIYSV